MIYKEIKGGVMVVMGYLRSILSQGWYKQKNCSSSKNQRIQKIQQHSQPDSSANYPQLLDNQDLDLLV